MKKVIKLINFNRNNKIRNYVLSNKIGEGSYGTVYLAHDEQNNKVAIKIIDKRKIDLNKFSREVEIFSRCKNHPYIVQYIEHFEQSNKYYIVMEYIEGGNLLSKLLRIYKFDVIIAKQIIVQIISVIEYLHGNLITYRDLKLDNILISKYDLENNYIQIKITDFGLANNIRLNQGTFCGSFEYAPPEIIEGKLYNSFDCDIWPIGIVLYALLTGYFPFDSKNIMEQTEEIIKCDYNKYYLKDFDDNIKDLIDRILKPANERIKLHEIKEHEWFHDTKIESYLNDYVIDIIDDRIINQIKLFGFRNDFILKSLSDNNKNEIKSIYNLIKNNKIVYNDKSTNTIGRKSGNRMSRSFRALSTLPDINDNIARSDTFFL